MPEVAVGWMSYDIEAEFAMADAANRCGELRFVRCENPNAFSSARYCDVPFRGVCRGAGGRVGKEDVFDGLALRAIARDGVASRALAESGWNDSSVFERDCSVFGNAGAGRTVVVLPSSENLRRDKSLLLRNSDAHRVPVFDRDSLIDPYERGDSVKS